MYDGFIRTDGDELWDRTWIAHDRFAEVVRSTPADLLAHRSTWTTRLVAAHVLTVVRRYTERDITDPSGLSEDGMALGQQNADEISAFERTSVEDLLDGIAETLGRIESDVVPRTADLQQTFPFHGGQRLDAAAALGNLIGEFLVHGRDVAKATRRRWPVTGRDAAQILNLGLQVGPGFVAPDAPKALKVELRTPHSRPWVLDLVDGHLESRAAVPGERVDARMYGRSQPLMLNLYRRIGLPGATLRGTAVIGGGRPWRALQLPRAFLTP